MPLDWAAAWTIHEAVLDTIPDRVEHNRRIVGARANLLTAATGDDPVATEQALSVLEAQLRQIQVSITYQAVMLTQKGELEALL